MIQIGICDDVAAERSALGEMLTQSSQHHRIGGLNIHEYANGEALLFDIESNRNVLDLLFLDIYMEGMIGIDVARELRQLGIKTPIVFLTTSPDFALESYDVEAAGYLLKPAKAEKVSRLLKKLLTPLETPRLAVKCGGRRQYFSYDELLYLESSNNTTLLHLSDGQTLRCGERLSALEKALSDKRFLRCHQSYLVNMDHIHRAAESFTLRNGKEIPIRVRSRREMNDTYYNYFIANCMKKLPEMEESRV